MKYILNLTTIIPALQGLPLITTNNAHPTFLVSSSTVNLLFSRSIRAGTCYFIG